jgi:hypothetical protein
VRNGGTGGSSEVKDFGAWTHPDIVNTTKDSGSELGAERVPNTVLDLLGGGAVLPGGPIDGDPLLSVDVLSGGGVLGDKSILLSAGDEDSSVTVRLNDNLGPSPSSSPPPSPPAAPTTASSASPPTAPTTASSAAPSAAPSTTSSTASSTASSTTSSTPPSAASAEATHFISS